MWTGTAWSGIDLFLNIGYTVYKPNEKCNKNYNFQDA